ncbi:MAG: hypothetical protein ACRDMX_10850 [Solirubrobacteraceae bacterium]
MTQANGILCDPACDERVLQDRAEQVERVADGYRTRACREPVGLPASDRPGIEVAQRDRGEVRRRWWS